LSLAGVLNQSDPVTVLAFDNAARILSIVNGLVNTGRGRTLTDTKVSTISGQTASINAFSDINIQTTTQGTATSIPVSQIQTIQAGTTVQITPTVFQQGSVFADIKIESSVPGAQATPSTAPNVSRRQVTNKLILHDGETLQIGGLIQTIVSENKVRFPIIGYLPLLGDLFSTTSNSNSTSELLVFVTAYLNRHPIETTVTTQSEPPTGLRLDIPNGLKLLPNLYPLDVQVTPRLLFAVCLDGGGIACSVGRVAIVVE
jgi:type II secretory pathway component GspD/PulD (secretin)